MSVVRVDRGLFFRGDIVINRELGGRRADVVHECQCHEHFGFDPRGEVVDVDIAEGVKDFLFALVARIE